MKTYILREFDIDSFKEITEFLDEVETNQLDAQIYINSWGWTIRVLESIRTRLHELLEKWINIKLRALFISSAAFDLFYTHKGDKVLEVWCDAIIHVSANEVNAFQTRDWIKLRVDIIDRKRFMENTFNYDFLTVSEDKKFNNWEDIYLDYKRLQSIFNKK